MQMTQMTRREGHIYLWFSVGLMEFCPDVPGLANLPHSALIAEIEA
jgi:hypothetical protein